MNRPLFYNPTFWAAEAVVWACIITSFFLTGPVSLAVSGTGVVVVVVILVWSLREWRNNTKRAQQ